MTSADDASQNTASPRRLLRSLRDVLFENTPQTPAEVSASRTLSSDPTAAEVEAARSVLRAAIDAQLGPGIREFSLQDQALTEALPDPAQRRRAALRVLSLKGASREQLCLEIERALSTLDGQAQAFAHKLRDRREGLETARRECIEQCARETSEAEQAIARLQAELETLQRASVESQARRDQQLAATEATLGELRARELGFQRAAQDFEQEYLNLKTQLCAESV